MTTGANDSVVVLVRLVILYNANEARKTPKNAASCTRWWEMMERDVVEERKREESKRKTAVYSNMLLLLPRMYRRETADHLQGVALDAWLRNRLSTRSAIGAVPARSRVLGRPDRVAPGSL